MSLRTVAAIRRLSGPARFQRRRPVRPWRVGRSAERRDSAPLVGGLIHIPRPTVSTPDLNGCRIERIPRQAQRGVVPPATPKLGRLRPEGVDAVSLHARRPETPRSGLLRRRLLSGALTCAAAVLRVLVPVGVLVLAHGCISGLSDPSPSPTVSITCDGKNPCSVAWKSTATIAWSATGISCFINRDGAFTGWSGVSGSQQTPELTADTTYTASCYGTSADVRVRVLPPFSVTAADGITGVPVSGVTVSTGLSSNPEIGSWKTLRRAQGGQTMTTTSAASRAR